jgi:hypothetical protein
VIFTITDDGTNSAAAKDGRFVIWQSGTIA